MRAYLTTLAAALLLVSLASCSGTGRLSEGIIDLEEEVEIFINAWGYPDRQRLITGSEVLEAKAGSGFGGISGSFFKGKHTYEVWEYDSRKTKLFFEDRELMGYQTELSRSELKMSFKRGLR